MISQHQAVLGPWRNRFPASKKILLLYFPAFILLIDEIRITRFNIFSDRNANMYTKLTFAVQKTFCEQRNWQPELAQGMLNSPVLIKTRIFRKIRSASEKILGKHPVNFSQRSFKQLLRVRIISENSRLCFFLWCWLVPGESKPITVYQLLF